VLWSRYRAGFFFFSGSLSLCVQLQVFRGLLFDLFFFRVDALCFLFYCFVGLVFLPMCFVQWIILELGWLLVVFFFSVRIFQAFLGCAIRSSPARLGRKLGLEIGGGNMHMHDLFFFGWNGNGMDGRHGNRMAFFFLKNQNKIFIFISPVLSFLGGGGEGGGEGVVVGMVWEESSSAPCRGWVSARPIPRVRAPTQLFFFCRIGGGLLLELGGNLDGESQRMREVSR
jgi:hypothetical protein